jgi:hypothetical protein
MVLYQDRAVAEKMARYETARTNGFLPSAVLRVAIPTSFISKCRTVILEGDEWKEVVYTFGKFQSLEGHATLAHVNQAQLITGNMSCYGMKAFQKMDAWEEVGDDHILEMEVERMGRKEKVKPRQWVFRIAAYDRHLSWEEEGFWAELQRVLQVKVELL